MKFKINKGYITQKLGNKTVIFDGEESVLYTFNETAFAIFHKIQSNWSQKDIIEFIVKQYRVTRNQAEKDLKEFIAELKKRNIISMLTAKIKH